MKPRSAPLRRAAVIRRRRLVALVAALGLVAGVVVAVLELSGSGGSSHPPLPGAGAAPATVLGSSASPTHRSAPKFKPAPAAVAAASRLALAAQVGQLFMLSLDGTDTPAVSALGGVPWGGVVFTASNFVSDGQVGALAADVTSALRTAAGAGGPGPLLAAAQEGGPDTAFRDLPPAAEPQIASSGPPSLAQSQAVAAGRRLRSLGFAMTLAPLADVDTPGGSLTGRLYSADPSVVARYAAAALSGYAQAGVIAAPGHFPGTGDASADPDQATATVGGSLAELQSRDLVPFRAIAPSAPVIVMSNAAYVAFDGVTPAALLPAAVTLLRSYGFGGVVMSDDLDAAAQATAASPGAVALQALRAGDDLLYVAGSSADARAAYQAILAAAGRSARVRSEVRDALLRDLTLKARYGLLG